MKNKKILAFLFIPFLIFVFNANGKNSLQEDKSNEQDKILITGKIETLHKEPIPEFKVKVLVNGEEQPILEKEPDIVDAPDAIQFDKLKEQICFRNPYPW